MMKAFWQYVKSKEFQNTMYLTIGLSFIYTLMSANEDTSGRDPLTFQDFKAKYLEKGLVKKIYVINKYLVEAELVPLANDSNGQYGANGMVPRVISFTIGSADVFEEQLDELQDRLQIPPSERIPVQ